MGSIDYNLTTNSPLHNRDAILKNTHNKWELSRVLSLFNLGLDVTNVLLQVEYLLDPLLFDYKSKRTVEYAILSMCNVILEHHERPGSYARILFVDFSSAFCTIQPHLMIRKRIGLGVGKHFVMLLHSILTNRSKYMNVSGLCSPHVSISS